MEELKSKINRMENRLTLFYMLQMEDLHTLKTEISRLDFTNSQSDNRITTITYSQFMESVTQLHLASFPPQVLKDSIGIIDEGIIAVIATDGSRKEVQGKPFASSSAVFGTVSPLNLARFVPNTSSTLHPEIDAIILALQTASKHSLKNVLIVSDNVTALKFFQVSFYAVTNSLALQDFLSKHPDLANYSTVIKDLLHHFDFIGIRWQKSHVSFSSDIYTELNQVADSWARNKVDEISANFFSATT